MADGTPAVSVPPLSQLYLYLTEGCNLACRHCWLAPPFDPGAEKAPVLRLGLLERAIDEARPLGLSGVKLTGGEPLLHPRIGEILDVIEREELSLTIETNGTLLTPGLARRLGAIAAPRRPHVSVSLDGVDAATHEAVRGVAGSFSKATNAVRLLAEAGLSPQIIFSVMRGNAAQVDDVVRLAGQLGAGSVKFNVIQPTARGERLHESEAALDVADYIRLAAHVDRELAPTTGLRLHVDVPAAFRPLGLLAGPGTGRCGIHGILGVLASGRYALCGIGEQVPELIFGEVGRDPLAEIWAAHPVLVRVREGVPARLTGICAECLLRSACLGACVAQNYYRSGDLLAPFWFCEEADRAGLFPATRRR
jgi:SynChlorMet cassette radical SAM/SPASM protein ScmF